MSIPARLIAALRRCSQSLPDPRTGHNTRYPMADFVLAAFAPFFMQSPSFLAHRRHLETAQGRSNCQTLFGMGKIPCDVRARTMLDPVEPSHFHPMFADVIAELRQSGALDAMRCLDGHLLIALDGTEYHCSREIHCPNGSHRKRGKDKIEYFHTMLAEGGHFLFVCKPDSHPAIEDFLTGIGPETLSNRGAKRIDATQSGQPALVRTGKKRVTYRYRWLNGVPLRGDEKSMTVNWFAIEIVDARGTVTYRNSFISDLAVHRGNVAAMAAAGRARWKIENEAFNTLKTKGVTAQVGDRRWRVDSRLGA